MLRTYFKVGGEHVTQQQTACTCHVMKQFHLTVTQDLGQTLAAAGGKS